MPRMLVDHVRMEEDFGQIPAKHSQRPYSLLLWLLVPLTLYLAINRQSLWIDEGYTVWFASHESFRSFFRHLMGTPGSPGDPQMLLYLSYMWVWIKIFGRSELALRAANIPFFLLLIGSAAWASRTLLRQPYLWVLFCLAPFVWFYLNEARPYMAVLAFTTTALVAMFAYVINPPKYRSWAPWCCLISALLACGSHIVGVFLIPLMIVFAFVTAATQAQFRHNLWLDWRLPGVCCLPAFAILGGFYAWASSYGVNMIRGQPGLLNLGVVAYEFLGFQGLGPPRDQARLGLNFALAAEYWPWLLLGLLAVTPIFMALFRTRPSKIAISASSSLVIGFAMAVAFSRHESFHVLGRHMAVFFPMLLLVTQFWLSKPQLHRAGRFITFGILSLSLAWGVSDLRMTLLPQYRKDDYRDASFVAQEKAQSTGADILWAADPHTAHYYGIAVMKNDQSSEIGPSEGLTLLTKSQATDAHNWSSDDIKQYFAASDKPVILVLSKAELFDNRHGWEVFVRQQKPVMIVQLRSFSIYEYRRDSSSLLRQDGNSASFALL
jgi:hypothetical protein